MQGVVYSKSLNTGWKPPARLRQMTQVCCWQLFPLPLWHCIPGAVPDLTEA